jgi:DNA-binding winged helix-turn-helix (wHTH) protein
LIYRFDSFELDGCQYRLSRGQETIHVKPGVLELLLLLLEHRERVVSKAELVSTVWRDRFIGDNVLSSTVYEARRALGENAGEARFIKTVHARGYQFHFRPVEVMDGEIEPPVEKDRCAYVQWTGGLTPLRHGANFIGRDLACAIVLERREVSRQHARIVVSSEGTATLEDLASKNGTFLNGVKVAAPTPLQAGDLIEIAGVALAFQGWLDLETVTHASFVLSRAQAPPADDIGAADPTGGTPATRAR